MPRLAVRLDAERRRRLDELAAQRGAPVSEVVRRLIDDAYEELVQERRREAARQLARLQVEDPPDAATLARELEAAHEPGVFIDAGYRLRSPAGHNPTGSGRSDGMEQIRTVSRETLDPGVPSFKVQGR